MPFGEIEEARDRGSVRVVMATVHPSGSLGNAQTPFSGGFGENCSYGVASKDGINCLGTRIAFMKFGSTALAPTIGSEVAGVVVEDGPTPDVLVSALLQRSTATANCSFWGACEQSTPRGWVETVHEAQYAPRELLGMFDRQHVS